VKIEFNFESPYQSDGSPRQDLPTGEVLAWDGKEWCNGFIEKTTPNSVMLLDETKQYIFLHNVRLFAPLPTIIEEHGNEVF